MDDSPKFVTNNHPLFQSLLKRIDAWQELVPLTSRWFVSPTVESQVHWFIASPVKLGHQMCHASMAPQVIIDGLGQDVKLVYHCGLTPKKHLSSTTGPGCCRCCRCMLLSLSSRLSLLSLLSLGVVVVVVVVAEVAAVGQTACSKLDGCLIKLATYNDFKTILEGLCNDHSFCFSHYSASCNRLICNVEHILNITMMRHLQISGNHQMGKLHLFDPAKT